MWKNKGTLESDQQYKRPREMNIKSSHKIAGSLCTGGTQPPVIKMKQHSLTALTSSVFGRDLCTTLGDPWQVTYFSGPPFLQLYNWGLD